MTDSLLQVISDLKPKDGYSAHARIGYFLAIRDVLSIMEGVRSDAESSPQRVAYSDDNAAPSNPCEIRVIDDNEAAEIGGRWSLATPDEKLAWHNNMAKPARGGSMSYVYEILELANYFANRRTTEPVTTLDLTNLTKAQPPKPIPYEPDEQMKAIMGVPEPVVGQEACLSSANVNKIFPSETAKNESQNEQPGEIQASINNLHDALCEMAGEINLMRQLLTPHFRVPEPAPLDKAVPLCPTCGKAENDICSDSFHISEH